MADAQAPLPKRAQLVPDLTGKTVGRFAIRMRLGAGGMGEVYRAEDTKLKRAVALKRVVPGLCADEQYRQRFLKEAEHASRLNDQRIAAIYDVLEEDDETFLVMEYVEGSTLRQRLPKPLSLEEFLPVAVECAEALAAAHEKGVVHRDIKPENIMLTPKGGVKILDFGVAKRLPRADDTTGTGSAGSGGQGPCGTPAYMAPEVLLERPSDARADIFSLGAVYYEMLSGRHPFLAENFVATADRILHDIPEPLSKLDPGIPANLERVVSRMLAKEPGDRYASANDLLADLRALERGEVLPARRTLSRRAFQSAAVAMVVVAVLGVLLLLASVPSVKQAIRRQLGLVTVPEQKHVAVLPFAVLGGSEEATAFSKGLAETLNAGLTRLTGRDFLQVVPASEVRTRGVTTAEQARKEFGVNLVIEGSLQSSGGKVRVTYALVDANTQRQLRAGTLTAAASDPFAVEDRVVGSVLDALEIELQPREREVLAAHGTREPAAYDYYLRGRGYLQDYHKPENIESAIAVFNRALQADSGYAPAYAGLGDAYWQKYLHTKEPLWVTRALAVCGQAVTLGPGLSDGHTCLGTVYKGTGKYEQAVEQFRQAVELEPTSDAAHRGLADAYDSLGKPKEAEKTYRRAINLRPHYWAGYSWLGYSYYMQGRYAEAAEMLLKVVELAPDSFQGYSNLGATYVAQGRYAEAIRVCERSAAIRPTAFAYSNVGTAHFYLGRFAEAAKAYQKAAEMEPQEYLWWGNLGDARYWAPGQRASATSAYEQAILRAKQYLRVNPRDARALGYLAYYYAMLENKQAALSAIEQALTLAPNDPELRFNAALTHNKLGQINQALEWLEKALTAGIDPATVRDSPFLDNLRRDPRFSQILQGHKS